MKDKSENTPASDVENPFVSKNVVLCTDGKYRWVYEMKLLKDFWVLGTILKIFGGIIGVIIPLPSSFLHPDIQLVEGGQQYHQREQQGHHDM